MSRGQNDFRVTAGKGEFHGSRHRIGCRHLRIGASGWHRHRVSPGHTHGAIDACRCNGHNSTRTDNPIDHDDLIGARARRSRHSTQR